MLLHRESMNNVRLVASLRLACVLLFFCAFGRQGESAPISAQQQEYRLGPGDVLDIRVWKEPDLSRAAVIRPDGNISIPMIGEVEAGGKTTEELKQAIIGKLRLYILRPGVDVIVKEINSTTIYVLGKVQKPSAYLVRGNATLLDAIAMAGGLRDDAKGNRVVIIRKRSGSLFPQKITLDLKRLISQKESGPIHLEPADTVYVPE